MPTGGMQVRHGAWQFRAQAACWGKARQATDPVCSPVLRGWSAARRRTQRPFSAACAPCTAYRRFVPNQKSRSDFQLRRREKNGLTCVMVLDQQDRERNQVGYRNQQTERY